MKKYISLAFLLALIAPALAAVNVTVNGSSYSIPQKNEKGWGDNVTAWIQAISAGTLQKSGGTFTLTADTYFGGTYGLVSQYFKSGSSNLSTSGALRLANTDVIGFRNAANSGNLTLGVDSSDRLTFNGNPLVGSSALTASKAVETNALGVLVSSSFAPATSSNTASSVVARDSSGNFSAGTITGNLTGNVTGNASTATALASNPSDCSAGQKATGIDASGNLTCSAVSMSADVTGVLPIANGGTSASTKAGAFDALSPNTTKGDFTVHNGTTNTRVAIGTDGQVPVADSSAANGLAWKSLQQGSKNYITYTDFESNATTGWSLARSTLDATSKVPNQASGSWSAAAGTMSIASTSSGALAGSYSLQLTSSAATTAGDMLVSQAYMIDPEDRGRTLAFSFSYQITSGASNATFSGTSTNSFAVAIYDVTAGSWVQPSGSFSIMSTQADTARGTFALPSTSSQFRLAIYNMNATSGAVTMLVDSVKVGPQVTSQGPVVAAWKTYTPTGSWTTNASYTGQWRQVGENMEVIATVTASGAPSSGLLTFTIPSGYTIDTSKMPGTVAEQNLGYGSIMDNGVADYGTAKVAYSNTTTVFVRNSTGNNVTPTAPFSFGASDYVTVRFSVPIVGWSGANLVSSDAGDSRLVATRLEKSGDQTAITSDVLLSGWATSFDTTGSWDSTNNRYVFPSSGVYDIDATGVFDTVSGTDRVLEYRIDGGSWQRCSQAPSAGASTYTFTQCKLQLRANAGQTLQFGAASGTSVSFKGYGVFTPSMINIKKVQAGSQQIAASDSFAASYTTTAAQSIPSGTATIVDFGTRAWDDTGALCTTGASFKCTAPAPGKYEVCSGAYLTSGGGWAEGEESTLSLFKNGVSFRYLKSMVMQDAHAAYVPLSGCAEVRLLATEYVDVRVYQTSGGAISLTTDAAGNWISFKRTGSY